MYRDPDSRLESLLLAIVYRPRRLARFYCRLAHRIPDVNPTTEHERLLRLVICPSGGW
jgi:hypothetical protein